MQDRLVPVGTQASQEQMEWLEGQEFWDLLAFQELQAVRKQKDQLEM